MASDLSWQNPLALDVQFGLLASDISSPKQNQPKVVLNGPGESVLRVIRQELARCDSFMFSVAFVTPRALALLKQELVDFQGNGRIITSNYLAFNSPAAFEELLNLTRIGIDVRLHKSQAFHPKGYIFDHRSTMTAMIGSSNLTAHALAMNHEWNLKVTAAHNSDLAHQFRTLIDDQLNESAPLTRDWIENYKHSYVAPSARPAPPDTGTKAVAKPGVLIPNSMQKDALTEIAKVRYHGAQRAIIISATGTGKTTLSALDAREFGARKLLFVVHREQILDRTIEEYQRVLGGPPSDYGKIAGGVFQPEARYVFATAQSLSKSATLTRFQPDTFDYIIIDEAHRAGAVTHRRILDYFHPQFLLGMTATPERTDGFNVFELFDFNVPYEIRLSRALDEGMLSPFHYYGISDVAFSSGETLSGNADLSLLISPERVDHLIQAIEIYGQASTAPRGLIFCSSVAEGLALSRELNARQLRGQPLRTVFLSGADAVSIREAAIQELLNGTLDYILSVDIFNEGVDIPSLNQVIMLRQTQSAIVFVQQLGRGLRKDPGKDSVIILDFIANYANNYLIPIALFGDESLNKESIKQHLVAAEESGILPGLSSVRFDKVSQERVLRSVTQTTLDSIHNLRRSLETLRNRLGRIPSLYDYFRFESVDPILMATRERTYPQLVRRLTGTPTGLDSKEEKSLELFSNEVLTSRRIHEFILLRELLTHRNLTIGDVSELFSAHGLRSDEAHVSSTISTFTLTQHAEVDLRRYGEPAMSVSPDQKLSLRSDIQTSLDRNLRFAQCVDDIIQTGIAIVSKTYSHSDTFTIGRQYSRKEVCRLLCWPRKWTSTLYGYKIDYKTKTCAIFITLHKSNEISASTRYADRLIDTTTILWYTKSRRTLLSREVLAITNNELQLHIFMKKDDAEGTEFYYLGRGESRSPEQTTMRTDTGAEVEVVRMLLSLPRPLDSALFDYFHPTLTEGDTPSLFSADQLP